MFACFIRLSKSHFCVNKVKKLTFLLVPSDMQFAKLPSFCFDIISQYFKAVLQHDLYIKGF